MTIFTRIFDSRGEQVAMSYTKDKVTLLDHFRETLSPGKTYQAMIFEQATFHHLQDITTENVDELLSRI